MAQPLPKRLQNQTRFCHATQQQDSDIYPKELKTYVHKKTCTWVFIAALFIIGKLGSSQDVLQSAKG